MVRRARTPLPTADKVSPAVIWHSAETLTNFAFAWQTLLQAKEAAAESGSAFLHKENIFWMSQRSNHDLLGVVYSPFQKQETNISI